MELVQELEQLGLNEKQARVYLAVLELGQATALEISRESKIKRSTTYVILDELQEQALIRHIRKGSTTIYEPAEPNVLGEQLTERLDSFSKIKPFLDDLYLKQGSKPNVHFYYGLEEFTQLYWKMFRENRQIDFFGVDVEAFETAIPKQTSDAFVDWLAQGSTSAREIVTHDRTSIEWAKRNHGRFHKIRVIDQKYQFASDNAIFGNTLLIASFDVPFAVTIESKDIIQTFRSMFEIMWSIARPARDIPKSEYL